MPSVYVHNLLLLLLVVSSFAVYNGVSAAGGYQPLQATGEHVEVLTKQGRLRGLVVDVTRDTRVGGNGGPTGKRVNAFLGVHYARPPGRFEVGWRRGRINKWNK
jgi:hypothetical protein